MSLYQALTKSWPAFQCFQKQLGPYPRPLMLQNERNFRIHDHKRVNLAMPASCSINFIFAPVPMINFRNSLSAYQKKKKNLRAYVSTVDNFLESDIGDRSDELSDDR